MISNTKKCINLLFILSVSGGYAYVFVVQAVESGKEYAVKVKKKMKIKRKKMLMFQKTIGT